MSLAIKVICVQMSFDGGKKLAGNWQMDRILIILRSKMTSGLHLILYWDYISLSYMFIGIYSRSQVSVYRTVLMSKFIFCLEIFDRTTDVYPISKNVAKTIYVRVIRLLLREKKKRLCRLLVMQFVVRKLFIT